MSVFIKWGGEALKKEIRQELDRRLDQAAEEVKVHVQETLSNGRRGQVGTSGYGPGTPPHVDTGKLRQSIFWTRAAEFVRQIGVAADSPAAVYAMTHEFGRVIRPKNGKFLAIPWSQQAKQHSRRGGSAKDFTVNGKRLHKIGRGPSTFFLVESVGGKKARSIIHYIITSKPVTIPPRPYLRPSLDRMRPRIQEIFRE